MMSTTVSHRGVLVVGSSLSSAFPRELSLRETIKSVPSALTNFNIVASEDPSIIEP